jgi:hypothetical protein
MRNTARYSPPVFEPDADKLHDWEIFSPRRARGPALGEEPKASAPPHEMIDLGLQFGPYGQDTEQG